MTLRLTFATLGAAALVTGCADAILQSGPIDTVAPTVQLDSPAGVLGGPNAPYVNTPIGELAGTLTDDREVVRATLQLNGGAEQSIPITPGATVRFTAQVDLSERDSNHILVHAYDAAGNRGSSDTLRMTVDTVPPPAADVYDPRDGETYATPGNQPLRVSGTADAYLIGFSLNGGPHSPAGFGALRCNFRCFEHLLQGMQPGENVLDVYTYDRAGNRTVRTIRFVWYELPTVKVTSHDPTWLAVSATSQIRITGSAASSQPVARVTWQVNDGPEQEIAGATGTEPSFEFTAPLRDGANEITVKAYNSAGSRSAAVVEVVRPLPAGTPGVWASLNRGTPQACGITLTGRAYCWGRHGTDWANLVEHPTPQPVAGSPSFTSIVPGGLFACGLDSDGAAHCWGMNDEGQLGTGTGGSRTNPSPVAGGHRFAQLSAGGTWFVCGTTLQGEAYCWGDGSYGQLGNGASGASAQAAEPVAVAGDLHWTEVSSGGFHACGLTSDGTAYCWGANGASQLGNASIAASPVPVAVAGGHRFVSISAGGLNTCALDASGAAFCWGTLRGPGPVSASPPAPVAGGLTFDAISLGGDHACGLTPEGHAYCWGRNANGQLGNGEMALAPTFDPVRVAGGLTFARIHAGDRFTCGTTHNGAAYCWGNGTNGQLGNGTRTRSNVPVRMIDPS